MEAKDSVWLRDWANEKVTLRIRIKRIFHFFEGWFYSVKVFFQRLFDKDHLSPNDIWNLSWSLAPKIYKYILRFKKMERNGYPGYFSEYNENEWKCKEDWKQAVKDGRFDPDVSAGTISGKDKWEQILDKILFSFEWLTQIEGCLSDRKAQAFYDKWGLKNPYAENEENKRVDYIYEMLPNYIKEQEDNDKTGLMKDYGGLAPECMSSQSDLHIKDPDKYRLLGEKVMYYNIEYEMDVIEKRVQEGLDLFGKYFRNLWD